MSQTIPENHKLMCRLWRQGASVTEISAAVGLSSSMIYSHIKYKYKIPRKPIHKHGILSYPERRRFLEQNYANVSANIIASIFGISVDTVRRTAKRLGLHHSEEYIREDYAYRAKKVVEYWKSHTRVFIPQPRDAKGRFLKSKLDNN